MLTRSRSLVFVFAVALMVAACGLAPVSAAGAEINTSAGLTGSGYPLALHGYDPVAYFEVGAPQRGKAVHSATHAGATYRFASAERLATFEANPSRFTPQFGGYCAFGVSVAKKFDGDPLQWAVVDDALYLNLNEEIRAMWTQDVPGNIAKARANWGDIAPSTPASL